MQLNFHAACGEPALEASGGDPSAIVQSLLDCTDIDADQLKEIRRVINAAARKAKEEEPS